VAGDRYLMASLSEDHNSCNAGRELLSPGSWCGVTETASSVCNSSPIVPEVSVLSLERRSPRRLSRKSCILVSGSEI